MQRIINHIQYSTGRDISVYSEFFIQKIISQRAAEISAGDEKDYPGYLESNPEESEQFLNALNISYSLFFRNPLDYGIIERFILPSLFHRKGKEQFSSVRIWSAGCADGSEPYSMAMIGNEVTQNLQIENPPLIFATDLSVKALNKARSGLYYPASLQNVKLNQMERFFTKTGQMYRVSDELKKQIEFTEYDLLDRKTGSPPSGIFGGFDMVICCNLMLYYRREIQQLMLKKLHASLERKGFLMVDPSEKAIVKSFSGFRLYSALGNIFVKN